MAEQMTSFADRFDTARERIDDEIQRVQREISTRRKRLERQLSSGRKTFEKQTRKQVKQIRGELRRNPLVRELERFQDGVGRQLEGAFETVLGAFQIASKSDVQRIDRKLTKLTKRLKEIERGRKSNGQAQAPIREI